MHRIVQEEVLSQLINRILTNAAGYVIHYIGILILYDVTFLFFFCVHLPMNNIYINY